MAVQDIFKFENLQYEFTTKHKNKEPDLSVFGRHFTDHMFQCRWSLQRGWDTPKIQPMRALRLHPNCKGLQYASQGFESMKAYRGDDGKVRVFRPEYYIQRFARTSKKAGLPSFDNAELMKCIKKLVAVDHEWVPSNAKGSLVIHIAIIATEANLNPTPANQVLMYAIMSPCGPLYVYLQDHQGLALTTEAKHARAWKGGSGSCQLGANYAPTLSILFDAMANQCHQVLYLYSREHFITEIGNMNIFIFWINEIGNEELLTPPLSGSLILPGIIRRSIIELVQKWGKPKAVEKAITMPTLKKAVMDNRVMEVFGSSTQGGVLPIASIRYEGRALAIPTLESGDRLYKRINDEICKIQYGRSTSSWVQEIAPHIRA